MSTAKKLLSGLETAIKEATKIGYKRGAKDVLKEFGPHAGRALRNGDGSIMKTFNEISKAIKKM
ncbi:hypothetical protein [Bacillus sp. REN16]|uniref:hypothetical protein n=1 Tax=Bacillus sp. REN16 TaxID=2887296 RepID=UPI001E31CBD0|nr:hypothetical protein [Bacillus sp. REN16]MCC3359718.1 hypothetical protein [Bacillus sp. REN16]